MILLKLKFGDWSIRYKLLSLLVLLGLITFTVSGTIAYIKNLTSLRQSVFNQLTGITRSKRSQIESYYQAIHNHVETLGDDRMFIGAMREFRDAYGELNKAPLRASTLDAVRANYRDDFYPEMRKLKMARKGFDAYLPVTPAAIQLQYLYIVKNPRAKGHREELIDPGDGSGYSRVHRKYHAIFQSIVRKFGYYDLYLIDSETGGQVYDVAKDRDFATSLVNGPYRTSNLAKVVRQCLATSNPDDVFFSDFEPYEASGGEPTQYVATPIFDDNERLGVLAFQLSTAAINKLLTGDRGWAREGLGQTGESLIVGQDHLARSDARKYLEDPEGFLSKRKAEGMSEETLNRIRTFETTILQMPVDYPSVDLALAGKQGLRIGFKEKGIGTSLVSYTPLQIEGLHWALVARMTSNEAFRPVREMQSVLSWWGAGLLLLTLLAAWLMTRQILRPVNALVEAARKVASGDLTAQVEWKWKDELGMLADTFNSMTNGIREKTGLIEQKARENEALLLNILPGEIANRLKGGENDIADAFADVTVLFGDLVGFTTLSSKVSASDIVEMLNGLFSRFDKISNELGIEKIKTIGDCYMGVCGLPTPCSDHAERMALLALRMLDATQDYGRKKGLNLQMRIGLNSGPVIAGVIGTSKFIYDLWGDTVNLASRMESTGVPDQIQVTRSVYERLKSNFVFESRGPIQVKGKGQIETWLLQGKVQTVEIAA